VSKGARFWGFLRFRESGVLGGNPSIPLDSTSFGEPNNSYGKPMMYSYYPKALCEFMERIRRSGSGFGGLDPRVVVHPERLGLTGRPMPSTRLTSASPYCFLARVNVLVCSLVSRFAVVSSLVLLGAWETCFLDLGFPGLDRSDRCVVSA
jgi:hypothetical protein